MEQIILQTPGMGPGRSHHILGTALAFAIAAIDALPEKAKPASDRDAMVAILLANFSEFEREMFAAQVERKTGHAPDMTDWKQT